MRMRVLASMLLGATLCSGSAVAADLAQASSPFGIAAATLPAGELDKIAGTANVDMEIRALNSSNVSNNSISGNSETGTIAFDSQSFQALSGLSVISANTGNNVAINSSLNVNVALRP